MSGLITPAVQLYLARQEEFETKNYDTLESALLLDDLDRLWWSMSGSEQRWITAYFVLNPVMTTIEQELALIGVKRAG